MVRRLRMAALAACALWAISQPSEARAPRTGIGSLHPQAVFWSGSVALTACARNPVARTAPSPAGFTPAQHAPSRERRGELIGEILGSPHAADAARRCAADAAPAGALIRDGEDLRRFHTAFLICLHEAHAAREVGALTLWVDTSCDW